MESIAEETGGNYYPLGPTGQGLVKVFENLQSIGQQKKREQLSTDLPIDRYQLFVIFGFFVSLYRNAYSENKKKEHFPGILNRNYVNTAITWVLQAR